MARKPQASRRLSTPRRRHMENRTYVGLDLSKTSTMATAVDPLGHRIRQEKLDEISIPLDREIHRAFLESKEAQLLATIPGVGAFTSMTLVAFHSPIERFYSLDAVVRYCGLCPSVRQSGERVYHGRLVWDCNMILKWVLVEGQWNVRLREKKGEVARVGRRVARRGATNDGAVAAARKLVRICAAILRRGTPYQPHFPGSSSRQVPSAAS
jgi:transposase